MDRAIPCGGSKLCARREDQRVLEMHRARLKSTRKLVDTSAPAAMSMDHVRNNLKKEQKMEEKYSEIDRENHILLKKMSHIMRSQGDSSPNSQQHASPRLAERPPPGPTSLNRDARRKELNRITRDNQSILRRIQQAQPAINHVELEGAHKKTTSYLKNCAEYPLVIRSPRSARGRQRDTSELSRLEDQPMPWRSARPSSLPPPQPRQQPPQQNSQSSPSDDAKYVLKESRRLGDPLFLIEMTTDNAGALNIRAYDGETQQQLELPLPEKAHRRLVRETNGNYSAVAARLYVATDAAGVQRLALLDAPASPSAGSADRDGLLGSAGTMSVLVDDEMRNTFEGFSAQVNVTEHPSDAEVKFRGLTASSEGGGR